MAGPRSFSQDGAFGSGTSPTGGIDMPDAPDTPDTQALATPTAYAAPEAYSRGGAGTSTPSAPTAPQGPRMGTPAWTSQFYQDTGGYQRAAGLSFADGGAIDDGSGGDSNGSPQQDAIQKALSTVDGVLAFGRKLHGLGGGDNEGAVQGANAPSTQVADAGYQNGRMPARPGNQSESGIPPVQPAPGPLPPTSNPFGKRTSDASGSGSGSDGDSGDQAIDTEETA